MFRRSARETGRRHLLYPPSTLYRDSRTSGLSLSTIPPAFARARVDAFLTVEDQWGLPVDRDQRYGDLEFLATSQHISGRSLRSFIIRIMMQTRFSKVMPTVFSELFNVKINQRCINGKRFCEKYCID